MAQLCCFPSGALEELHKDFQTDSSSVDGRELSFVLFLQSHEDGGLRAYVDGQELVQEEAVAGSCKDLAPTVGRCLVFRSRQLWHEVLASKQRLYVLTLFAYRG